MRLLVSVFCFFIIYGIQASDINNQRIDKLIKSVFQIENYRSEAKLINEDLKDELKADFWNNNFFEIKKGESLIGYAYFGKGFGKTDNFEYLLLFNSDLIIVKSKVIKYIEDYGGEIGSKRWLKQFIGKTSKDKLLYGENIAAISGATLSVKSMTNSVNKVLESIGVLQSKKII